MLCKLLCNISLFGRQCLQLRSSLVTRRSLSFKTKKVKNTKLLLCHSNSTNTAETSNPRFFDNLPELQAAPPVVVVVPVPWRSNVVLAAGAQVYNIISDTKLVTLVFIIYIQSIFIPCSEHVMLEKKEGGSWFWHWYRVYGDKAGNSQPIPGWRRVSPPL